MADTFSRAKRSEVMARIRGMDTEPELAVRRALHRMGYRFRVHVMSLPGRPDIVLPRHRTIVQVKGCFWHGHFCLGGRVPPGKYWRDKLARNKARDKRNGRRLRVLGWRLRSVWECSLRRSPPAEVEARLRKLLSWLPPKQVRSRSRPVQAAKGRRHRPRPRAVVA